jgi:hypothetical protein
VCLSTDRTGLPEFFSGPLAAAQGESVYRQLRNFIVSTYRENPRVFLTATAVRRLVAADAGAVLRVHSFLSDWGLINYHVDPGTTPVQTSAGNLPQSHFPVLTHDVHATSMAAAAAAGNGIGLKGLGTASGIGADAARAKSSSASDLKAADEKESVASELRSVLNTARIRTSARLSAALSVSFASPRRVSPFADDRV